jgi:hypothetical protein
MMIDRRLLAGAFGLSLALAACGGASTASSSPSAATAGPTDAATTEQPAATEGPAATAEPSATEQPAATAQPTDESGSGGGQVNDLAAMLPEKAGDLTFDRVGYDGDQLGIFGAAAGLNSAELDPLLKASGKTLNDVNFAVATATGGTTDTGGMIYAIQIEGLDATKLAASMGMDPSSMPKTTLGGKTVYGEASGGFGAFAYPKDDKLFIVLLMDEKTASSVFEQLP